MYFSSEKKTLFKSGKVDNVLRDALSNWSQSRLSLIRQHKKKKKILLFLLKHPVLSQMEESLCSMWVNVCDCAETNCSRRVGSWFAAQQCAQPALKMHEMSKRFSPPLYKNRKERRLLLLLLQPQLCFPQCSSDLYRADGWMDGREAPLALITECFVCVSILSLGKAQVPEGFGTVAAGHRGETTAAHLIKCSVVETKVLVLPWKFCQVTQQYVTSLSSLSLTWCVFCCFCFFCCGFPRRSTRTPAAMWSIKRPTRIWRDRACCECSRKRLQEGENSRLSSV